ncbi:MAG: hypothetical protein ACOCXK_02550 [Rhodosalinus sp.]
MSYLESFPDTARLCDIIIPGSHDAGIHTVAVSNVQTQDVGIGKQAEYGCRFFDLRIGYHKTKKGIEPQAYHANTRLVTKKKAHMNISKIGGGWGDALDNMLTEAASFVGNNKREFLILKFSKCMRWSDVAKACVAILGPVHFKPGKTAGSNLNVEPIGNLRGTVITIFDDTEETRDSLKPDFDIDKGTDGILLCRGLFSKEANRRKAYVSDYAGLQYFGKFSDSPKAQTVAKGQATRLEEGSRMNPDVLGMMYWTATGWVGSIKKRDAELWKDPRKLRGVWRYGLKASIDAQLGRDGKLLFGPGKLNPAGLLKTFMPNIVMMDFVSKERCDTVLNLNTTSDHDLRNAMQVLAPAAPPPPKSPPAAPPPRDAVRRGRVGIGAHR